MTKEVYYQKRCIERTLNLVLTELNMHQIFYDIVDTHSSALYPQVGDLQIYKTTNTYNSEYMITFIYNFVIKYNLFAFTPTTVTDYEYAQNGIISLAEFKQNKLKEIDNGYSVREASGYYDGTENVTLGLSDNDRNMLNQLLTMLNLAESLGELVPTIQIGDINNIVHEYTSLQLKGLLLRYGFGYQTLWGTYAAHRAGVIGATTIDEVNLISW